MSDLLNPLVPASDPFAVVAKPPTTLDFSSPNGTDYEAKHSYETAAVKPEVVEEPEPPTLLDLDDVADEADEDDEEFDEDDDFEDETDDFVDYLD